MINKILTGLNGYLFDKFFFNIHFILYIMLKLLKMFLISKYTNQTRYLQNVLKMQIFFSLFLAVKFLHLENAYGFVGFGMTGI